MRSWLTAVLAVSLLLGACAGPPEQERPALAVTEVLGGDAEGYARADAPRTFDFPADHGSHPGFRTEWWYFTGHLDGDGGVEYGFQLTFFRSALAPPGAAPEGDSAWRADDLWMAHLAVGNYAGGEFRSFERFARGALGLAGAAGEHFEVWLEDWRVEAERPADPDSPLRLVAAAGAVRLDLRLVPVRPPLLQGDAGLSQKGSEPGNASYYYSVTRWEVAGAAGWDGQDGEVTGSAWLDREWSTSALEEGQTGWDWFSLQLDDGSDLMLYLMRRADGSVDPTSSGTFFAADGGVVRLSRDDYAVEALDRWQSPTGATYPAGWRLVVPRLDLRLEVQPRLDDQELRHTFRYWEGGVAARGERAGAEVVGRGFVELTGY